MHVYIKGRIACCILLGFLMVATSAKSQDIYLKDDFETDKISSIWSTIKLPDNAFNKTISHVRTGNGALNITVYSGAETDVGRDEQLTERAELREASSIRLKMGMEVWYAFSFFLPSGFPIVDTRLVIAQWKQACGDCTKHHSPFLSLRYYGGKLRVYVQKGIGKRKLFVEKMDLRNQWIDMVFRILPKTDKTGILQVWMNGKQIVDYLGGMGYKDDKEETMFKIGLYRDHMKIPMEIVIDRFRRGRSYSEVSISEK